MKRLGVLLLLALGGGWLWYGAGGLFPSKRTLRCTLESPPPVLQAEFQLWREETLLFRSVLQNLSSHSWTQEVQLKPGRHWVQLLTWASEGQSPHVHKQFLEVGDQKELHLRF